MSQTTKRLAWLLAVLNVTVPGINDCREQGMNADLA